MEKVRSGAAEGEILVEVLGTSMKLKVHAGKALLPKGFAYVEPKRKTVRRKKASRQPRSLNIQDTSGYAPDAVALRLVKTLGNNTVAALLGVSADRPGRWASGVEEPTRENRAELTDLDGLVGHLLAAFTPEQATLWLDGQNPHLGARPIDVYRIDGAAPVIEAMKAFEQGAFA